MDRNTGYSIDTVELKELTITPQAGRVNKPASLSPDKISRLAVTGYMPEEKAQHPRLQDHHTSMYTRNMTEAQESTKMVETVRPSSPKAAVTSTSSQVSLTPQTLLDYQAEQIDCAEFMSTHDTKSDLIQSSVGDRVNDNDNHRIDNLGCPDNGSMPPEQAVLAVTSHSHVMLTNTVMEVRHTACHWNQSNTNINPANFSDLFGLVAADTLHSSPQKQSTELTLDATKNSLHGNLEEDRSTQELAESTSKA